MSIRPARPVFCAAMAFAFAFPGAANGEKATPLKVIQTTEARFPPSHSRSVVSGAYATVLVSVGADGRLLDALALEYSHVNFARAAEGLLREWEFEPATVDGEPVASRAALRMNFEPSMRVVSMTAMETPTALLRRTVGDKGLNLVASAGDLDEPLAVLESARPEHPGLVEGTGEARAVLDFYVDTTGRTRLPVVLETTDPVCAEAAVRALETWRFAVPTRGGEPVIVRTRQEFVFASGA